MGLGLGLCCCGGCQCLRYQDGAFRLDPHIALTTDPVSVAYGVHIGVIRQADLTVWKGAAALGLATNVMGIRVPTSGKPRLIFLYNPGTTTLVSADFDALAARPGVLFECQSNVWTVIESNDFTYLGTPITAASSLVDGIASVPTTSPVAPDNVWCNPSYVPDSIQATFADWVSETNTPRANFNGVPMAVPLSGTTISGSRTIRNYGAGTPVYFYSSATIVCNAANHYPQYTLRWKVTAQSNTATVADGTASQIFVQIGEDQASLAAGCYDFSPTFPGPNTVTFKYLSTFDVLDDQPLVTHWIKKTKSGEFPDPGIDGTTYRRKTGGGNPIGTLLRCFP